MAAKKEGPEPSETVPPAADPPATTMPIQRDDDQAPDVVDAPKTGPASADGTFVEVSLRRDANVGDIHAKAGSVIAVVELAPGVTLNYVVDAVRNGLAGEAAEPSEAPKPTPRKRSGKRR